MMRNLAILLVITTAAFGQAQTAQTSAAAKPATVSVKPAAVSAKPATISAKPAHTAHAAKSATTTKASAVKAGTTAAAKLSAPSAKKPEVIAAKPASGTKTHVKSEVKPVAASPVMAKPVVAKKAVTPAKPAVVKAVANAKPATKAVSAKSIPAAKVKPAVATSESTAKEKAETAKPVVASVAQTAKSENKPADEPKKEIHFEGRRDPFISPVVAMGATGSGCSTGKRCLAIDQIALKGVVKAESGMIAVVANSLDKAYFLRENDPVFNGYVVKITGDSIVFKETFHDRLGKTLTRDVTKTITRPAA
jgi:hypothetical protein